MLSGAVYQDDEIKDWILQTIYSDPESKEYVLASAGKNLKANLKGIPGGTHKDVGFLYALFRVDQGVTDLIKTLLDLKRVAIAYVVKIQDGLGGNDFVLAKKSETV